MDLGDSLWFGDDEGGGFPGGNANGGGDTTFFSGATDHGASKSGDSQNKNGNTSNKNGKKKKPDSAKKKAPGGTFQSFGLSFAVTKAVTRKGYNIPTPIQRRAIPPAIDGSDIVAMARTGSGKTAAFLLPMIEKLKSHESTVGVRALVLSPTRELALQTLKFFKEFARFTDLRVACIVGGESIEGQFEDLSGNPDVIIATPGRLLHLTVEIADFQLSSVEVLVCDEADRLFEMGFQGQIEALMESMPERRQTLLFSATMPKVVAEFVRAGLREPVIVRLDGESKISDDLSLAFLLVRPDEKFGALLHLLSERIGSKQPTIVFAATRHHVELIEKLLCKAMISCAVVYGTMDHAARKINIAKFRNATVSVLIVTDVAARGIDIPLLDNVINFDFPPTPKLFVHRVGRAARAGRTGTAYNLVSPDEEPYMVDLHLFLGRPLLSGGAAEMAALGGIIGKDYENNDGDADADDNDNENTDNDVKNDGKNKNKKNKKNKKNQKNKKNGDTAEKGEETQVDFKKISRKHFYYGRIPDEFLQPDVETVRGFVNRDMEMEKLVRSVKNAYKLYYRTRSPASQASVKRSKEIDRFKSHPMFFEDLYGGDKDDDSKRNGDEETSGVRAKINKLLKANSRKSRASNGDDDNNATANSGNRTFVVKDSVKLRHERENMLERIRNYRPKATVLEEPAFDKKGNKRLIGGGASGDGPGDAQPLFSVMRTMRRRNAGAISAEAKRVADVRRRRADEVQIVVGQTKRISKDATATSTSSIFDDDGDDEEDNTGLATLGIDTAGNDDDNDDEGPSRKKRKKSEAVADQSAFRLPSGPKATTDSFYSLKQPRNGGDGGRATDSGSGTGLSTQPNMNDLIMDLVPEDAASILQRRTVTTWDAKKRKYVTLRGGDAGKFLEKANRKSESGAVIRERMRKGSKGSKSDNLYEEWKKRTGERVPRIGETEDAKAVNKVAAKAASRRYRHTMNKKTDLAMDPAFVDETSEAAQKAKKMKAYVAGRKSDGIKTTDMVAAERRKKAKKEYAQKKFKKGDSKKAGLGSWRDKGSARRAAKGTDKGAAPKRSKVLGGKRKR